MSESLRGGEIVNSLWLLQYGKAVATTSMSTMKKVCLRRPARRSSKCATRIGKIGVLHARFRASSDYTKEPAYDTVIQAMSGIMSVTGFPDGPPTRVGTSLSDLCAGMFLFCGIASALYAREKTGKGARIDVAMLDSTLAFLEHGLMEYVATGKAPGRIGNRHPFMTPFDTFDAADQPFAICVGNDKLFAALCEAVGKPELVTQPRFKTNVDRMTNNVALKVELESALKTQPAAHWLKVIRDAGVPVAPLLNVAEAAELPQTKARNMVIEAGGVRMPGNPVKISGYEDPAVRIGAPDLDQHGPALRKEFATQSPAAAG